MGRKHKRPRVTWGFDDECTMLAFLEFRIGRGETDRVRNIHAIVQHLSETRPQRFTAAQVEDKLNEIQNQAMRKPRKGTIFSEGLKVLSKLPHDERVNRLKQQLDDELLADMMREKRPRLRSDSHGTDASRPRSRKHLTPAEIPESPSSRRVLSTASGHKRSRSNLSSRDSASPLVKRSHFAAQSPHTPSNRTLSPKHEEYDENEMDFASPHPTVRVIVPDSGDIMGDDDRLSYASHGERTSQNRNKLIAPTANSVLPKGVPHSFGSNSSVAKIEGLKLEVKHLKEELARLRRDRRHLDSQMHTMNLTLETALRECQQRCEQYNEDVKCLKYTLSEKNPAEKTLLYQEREIETLKRSLREMKQNTGFSRLPAGEHYVPKEDYVKEVMLNIHYETKKILFSYEDNFTVRMPDLDDEYDLRSLFRRTLGINPSSPIRPETLSTILERNGLQAIICALAAAALCEWVFESDFESTIAQPSMFLNMYRQHISSIDGNIALRNVDIAASKLLFESDYYSNHVVPARAKELASMLSDTLAPLIPKDKSLPRRRSIESFHTWGEEIQESARREKRFVDIFKLALRLKGQLLASTGLFSFILYPHGTGFDKDSMIAETKHGDSPLKSSNTEPVQLCLLPAIYVNPRPRQGVVSHKIEIQSECPKELGLCIISKAIAVLD